MNEFFGAKSCLFAIDAPCAAAGGRTLIGNKIDAVAALDIPPEAGEQILAGKARTS